MDDENPTAYEDLGYRKGVDVLKEPGVNRQVNRVRYTYEVKRIRYTQGMMKGDERTIQARIADDLIERGVAVEIDRQPGEEG
jgi:hypothetical protein